MNSRDGVRRFAIVLTPALSLIVGPLAAAPLLAAPPGSDIPAPSTDSPSVVVMDAVSGRVLAQKYAVLKRNRASVTKIVTLVLALEDITSGRVKLTYEAVCGENAWEMGRTEEAFVDRMNQRAKEFGMKDTDREHPTAWTPAVIRPLLWIW